MADNNKPVHEVRIGSVRAAVWLNEGKNGPWHNVTITRTYQDGDDYRETSTYGIGELLAVAKAADLAHTWCLENKLTA
jgi:hypothetical protein